MIEVVYRWPDGREEVRYRRPAGSEDAKRFEAEVATLRLRLGTKCPYLIRSTAAAAQAAAGRGAAS